MTAPTGRSEFPVVVQFSYIEWLRERKRQHSISNMHFVDWTARRDKTHGF